MESSTQGCSRRFGLAVVSSAVLGVALAGVVGCSSTEFKSTWKDPQAQRIELQGKRVATFAVSKDEAQRRAAEDAMARELTERGVVAVPGYRLSPDGATADKQALRAKLRAANIDGAVVMRVVDRRQETSYVPGGPAYGSFYGYWDYGWSSVGAPGYLTTDTIVSIETLVYSVAQDKLMWGGVSETFDPGKTDKVVGEIIDKAAEEMRKAGLIGP